MPIDPRIPMGIAPVQVDTPTNTLGRMYQFQAMQAEAQQRQMQLAASRRAEADRMAMAQAYSQPRLTRETTIEALRKSGSAHLIPAAMKQFDDWDEAAGKRRESLNKAREAEQAYIGRLFEGVAKNGYDVNAAIAAIDHAEGEMGEEFAPRAETYRRQIEATGGDPKKVQQVIDGIRALDPQYPQRQSAETRAATEARKAQEAEEAKPGREADIRAKQRADAAATLGAATSQSEYNTLRNGLPFAIARLFPDTFNRERVMQVGLTPEQAAVDADRDAARGLTERSTRTGERQASVAEGNLRQRQAEEANRVARGESGKELSPEARATAERWKSTELSKLRGQWEDFAEKDSSGKDRLDEYEAAELRIENEYRAQMGLPRVSTLPWKSDARLTKAPTPDTSASIAKAPVPDKSSGAVGANRLGNLVPGASMRPAPAHERAQSVPADVQAALRDQRPGRYTGEDDSVWEKRRDGTIVRIK